ncbi:HNH endonuclease [Metaclostridioides mangenotii]|uniref:5-methylcytosine-specific restriction protein A n=1 Tax=Metaclostridioides mangenotii TaxID=1540 RepID=A0ABS4E7Y5_9FIRM|nr:HNH endonuclease signature motif containing protein [Clostridioides mangenotii]MBP1854055.1 5-methylcytosine-specific restriction protein A [Clostridioides mangenotii]
MKNRFGLSQGDVLQNDDIMKAFACSGQGCMRKSNSTNTLVLISDETKGLYEDKWYKNEFHYTGMGKNGDQSLDFMQNKTLALSNENTVEIHLFEVFEKKRYTYIGQVYLIGEPYQSIQQGEDGIDRTVWIFKLKLISDYGLPNIEKGVFERNSDMKVRKIKKLKAEEIIDKAKKVKGKAGAVNVISQTHSRNQIIIGYTKMRAKGFCELCKEKAPFINLNNEPYLEVHHIIWLSKGGNDDIDNTVALCPNCHKKMHILNIDKDVEHLSNLNKYIIHT